MSTRAVVLLTSSTSLTLLIACGGAQEASRYDTSTPMEESMSDGVSDPPQIYARSAGGHSEGRDYSFEDDVVEGELVRPDGEMAMSSYGGAEPSDAPMSQPSPATPAMAPSADESSGMSRSERRANRRDRRSAREAERSRTSDSDVSASPPPSKRSSSSSLDISVEGAVSVGAPINEIPPPPPPAPVYRPAPVVVQLTAASVGDADRRGPYLDYLTRHPAEASQIGLDMSRRVRFRVLDQRSRPVNDAAITFTAGGARVQGRTHADGYWDFYPGVNAPRAQGSTAVTIQWGNHQEQASVPIPAAGDSQDVVIQLNRAVAPAPTTLDLGFLIDVTGSMGDELAYVNAEVQGIVRRVREANNQVNVRVGATFYRDRGDMHPLHQIDFTNNIGAFNAQMSRVSAGGGGDYPEDVNAGLQAALTQMSWSQGASVRVLVVIADAPPQRYPDAQYTYHHAMVEAGRRGIRILPVAASGSDRVVEYLFRAMGAYTSTPYVYLTNDSGIGGHHMEADTDRISVEMFSDLLTRMLISDLQGMGMHEPSHAQQGGVMLGLVQ